MRIVAGKATQPDLTGLRSLLRAGLVAAQRQGRPGLVSVTIPVPSIDPLTFFARGADLALERAFWARPDQDFGLAGVDVAWTLAPRGENRFADAAREWQGILDQALINGPESAAMIGPILLGGFAFDPQRPPTTLWKGYPEGRLVLPRYLLTQTADATSLTINAMIAPDTDIGSVAESARLAEARLLAPTSDWAPGASTGEISSIAEERSASAWQAIVAAAVRDLRAGRIEKIVLARSTRVRGRKRFDPARALGWLRTRYPHCFSFAFARGDRCFLGASPEQLVALREGELRAMSLAGTAARGATEAEDRQLGEALLASAKNRAEHAIVVRALRETLRGLGIDPTEGAEPRLLRLENLQHLLTPVTARVGPGRSILDLVGHLHPTPAVGGYPKDLALRLIRECEGLDRGWYAGPVGWVDQYGGGEFAVALRSALLDAGEATLFAGCGIVPDSDPASEYAESALKLRPMLAALASSQGSCLGTDADDLTRRANSSGSSPILSPDPTPAACDGKEGAS